MSDLTKVSRGTPDQIAPVPLPVLKGVTYVLDLNQPHVCFYNKQPSLICDECRNGTPRDSTPGCELAEQNGHVYGWSESNCQYEVIGRLRDENIGV